MTKFDSHPFPTLSIHCVCRNDFTSNFSKFNLLFFIIIFFFLVFEPNIVLLNQNLVLPK